MTLPLTALVAAVVFLADADFAGTWHGAIQAPTASIELEITLTSDGEATEGVITIPAQGVEDFPLEVSTDGHEIRMVMRGVPGEPRFAGALAEDSIRGRFTQAAAELDFALERGGLAPRVRPQHPEPPYPYRAEEVTYGDDVKLAGTLTLPEGDGPFPAAVLITGSGPQDRDETLLGHKPFLVIADHLTRAGIAVLRFDDRGVGKSTGDFAAATSRDFADDVRAGVDFLAGRDDVASDAIGLIGHSEGGLIAPMVAAIDDRVAWLVLLAGPGVTGREILARQRRLITAANGQPMSDETLLKADRLVQLAAADDVDEEALRAATRVQIAIARGIEPDDVPLDDAELVATVRQVGGPWFRFFVRYDPRTDLRRVDVPVLALNGELDLQVDPAQNLPEIEEALRDAGNDDVTVRELEGLNHLFQTATTGSPDEYEKIEETFSPIALDAMTDWIRTRFGSRD